MITKAIGSEYVYQIEADEKVKRWYPDDDDENKSSWITWFLKDWVKEMKKEVKRKLSE